MSIAEAFKTQKITFAQAMGSTWEVESFIKTYCPDGNDKITLLKKDKDNYEYSVRGEGYWTAMGKFRLNEYIQQCITDEANSTQFDPLPTTGPDFSNGPQNPAEALELLLIQPRLSSRSYTVEVDGLLQSIYQNLQHMGADFRELRMKVGTERLRLADERKVDWTILKEISEELILIGQGLSEEIETVKSKALKDGSTFESMMAYITEAVKDKTLSKATAGLATQAYKTYENQNKALALRRMRDILKSNTNKG